MNAILGEKLGMTQIFDDQARAVPVTVIKAGPCHVVQIKNIDTDGYSAIQIAFGESAEDVGKEWRRYLREDVPRAGSPDALDELHW